MESWRESVDSRTMKTDVEIAAEFTPRPIQEIANTLGISTQAVHSRIKGAGAKALRQAVKHWEDQKDRAPC